MELQKVQVQECPTPIQEITEIFSVIPNMYHQLLKSQVIAAENLLVPEIEQIIRDLAIQKVQVIHLNRARAADQAAPIPLAVHLRLPGLLSQVAAVRQDHHAPDN